MDAIIAGGGNTLNMLALWKAQGMRVFYVECTDGESISNFTLPLEAEIIVWENMRTQFFAQTVQFFFNRLG